MATSGVKSSGKGRKRERHDQNQQKAMEEQIESLLQEMESTSLTDRSAEELEIKFENVAQEKGALLTKRLRRLARDRDSLSPWLRLMGRQAFVAPLRDLSRDSEIKASMRLEVMELLTNLGEPVDQEELEHLQREEEFLRTALADLSEEKQETLSPLVASFQSLPPSAYTRVLSRLVQKAAGKAFLFLETLIKEEGTKENAAEAALEILGSLALPESLHLLEEVASSSYSKVRQKIAKRSHYRIRNARPDLSALVAPSPRLETRPPLAPPEFKILHSLTTFIDGAGSRLLFLAKTQPMGKVKEVFVHADDFKGIQTYQVNELSRKVVEPMVKNELLPSGQWVEIDPIAWKSLIEEYRQWNQTSHSSVPEQTFLVLNLLDNLGELPSHSMIYQKFDEKAIRDDPYLLVRSPNLFESKEFSGWFFSPSHLEAYLQNLKEAEEGAIIVSEAMKREKIETAYQTALLELFDPESRKRYQRRLEEMAYLLWATERKEEAKTAFAAALALESLEGERLREHPWVRKMIERSVDFAERGKDFESSTALPKMIIDPFAEQGK